MHAIERISTGSPRLDQALAGGIPSRSITLVAGAPGTGKSLLALQTIFAAARKGRRSVYFTTLSEPSMKLLRYMQLYEFFDPQLFQDLVTLADLGAVLRQKGATAALASLVERVEAELPEIVVVDSFKALHDLTAASIQRSFVYDLAVSMAAWGATTFLVGEYSDEEVASLPEFAVADGIIRLSITHAGLAARRQCEVLKLRGSSYLPGVHTFEISARGMEFYPRLHGPSGQDDRPLRHDARLSIGVAGIDQMLSGGLYDGTSTLVVGGTGTGKTLLGLTFLLEGLRHGEPGLLLALEESLEQLRSTAHRFGWDLESFERRGLLRMVYTSPIELAPDRFLHDARTAIRDLGARRVVIDSLTALALSVEPDRVFRELVYVLSKHLRAAAATSLLPMEVPELLGTGKISGHGLSFAVDNVIFIRYVEAAGHLERAITVIKARGIEHSTDLRSMAVTRRGVEVGEALEDLQGVLTGLPSHRRAPR